MNIFFYQNHYEKNFLAACGRNFFLAFLGNIAYLGQRLLLPSWVAHPPSNLERSDVVSHLPYPRAGAWHRYGKLDYCYIVAGSIYALL